MTSSKLNMAISAGLLCCAMQRQRRAGRGEDDIEGAPSWFRQRDG